MTRIYLCILLVIASVSKAEIIDIKNVSLKKTKSSITIYMDIYNNSNSVFYLVAKNLDPRFKIFKTVIDNDIAQIIEIDRLVIPDNSKISLAPLGIYLVVKNFSAEQKPTIDLLFQSDEQDFQAKIKLNFVTK